MEEDLYYKLFEDRVTQELLRLCTAAKVLDGQLLASDDTDAKWKEMAPDYMADSVGEIAQYPEAAVAWAGYVGLAVARRWHDDWARYQSYPYASLHGSRGFDDMDEHIVRDILGHRLDSPEARQIESVMGTCSRAVINLIRHENIEPASKRAFLVYARAERAMFRIGVSMELYALGYHWEQHG